MPLTGKLPARFCPLLFSISTHYDTMQSKRTKHRNAVGCFFDMERQKRFFNKPERLLLFIALPLMLLFCIAVWLIQGSIPVETVRSQQGVWDLRDVDFDATNVRFQGVVEYIPHALLTPEEFAARADEAEIVDPFGHSAAFGTSRIRLLVPDGRAYVIAESSPLACDRMYVNGVWIEDIGKPGDSAQTTTEGDVLFSYTVYPEDGVIELVQQVSNFAHRKNESHAGYVVGSVPMMRAFVSCTYVVTALLIGCFITLFLVHITLWLLFRGYKANLYFALFCLTWVFRTAVTGPKLVTALFPSFSWFAAFAIEYVSMAPAMVLFLLIYSAMFPGVIQKWYLWLVAVASALWAGVHAVFDSLTISQLLSYYQMLMGVTIVYILVRSVVKIRRVALPQSLFLCGSAIMAYATVRDILFYRDIFIPPYGAYANAPLSEMALLLFVFLQMTAVFIGTIREMDAVRAKEQRLLAENAALDRVSRLRADLLDTLSHELRTPLAVMMGYAELAVKELRLKGVAQETTADLDVIAAEAGRLAVLVEEARRLSLSRDAAENRRPFPPGEVIRQTARLYAPILQRHGTLLELELAPDLPMVYGTPDELTQVLFNLLTNAGKHTENGHVRISAALEEGAVRISVADDGSGIRAEFLPHAFEKYAHDDPDGSGLGLSLCRVIVVGFGGKIAMESELGAGTRVTFTLPAHDGGEAP